MAQIIFTRDEVIQAFTDNADEFKVLTPEMRAVVANDTAKVLSGENGVPFIPSPINFAAMLQPMAVAFVSREFGEDAADPIRGTAELTAFIQIARQLTRGV